MEKKKVLITGGAGFLGSHLSDRFMKEGYKVVVMDNLVTGSMKNIEHLMKEKEGLLVCSYVARNSAVI